MAWDHAWDAADAIAYDDDGKRFDMPPATRVDRVPDYNGGHDLLRDDGSLFGIYDLPRGSGPLLLGSDPRFNGRPSWYSDTIYPHGNNPIAYFYSTHSFLTSGLGGAGDFNWLQPWWGAVLCQAVGPFVGHNHAYIDGNPGMTTIGRSSVGTVQMRAWPNGNTFGPTINSGIAFSEDTVLVQWHANGENSWLEINYRSAKQGIVTKRTPGAIAVSQMEQLHSGLSYTNYTSCIGIKRGVPEVEETDQVRDWAIQHIPTASLLT